MSLSLFTFYWNGVKNANYNPNDWFGDPSLREPHLIFNEDFARAFPRNLYTNPSTGYTDSGIGIDSQLRGTAETVGDYDSVRNWILQEAAYAGISGNPSMLHITINTIDEIQQGASVISGNAPNTISPYITSDGLDQVLQDLIDKGKGVATGALKTYVVIGGVFLALFLITQRRR